MKLYHQKLQVRQKQKELATPNSHKHDILCIFLNIYSSCFLGSLIIFNYQTVAKASMERKARVPLFKLYFWSIFPKLPTKWRKQAQKSSNIWHKPSWRCSRGPLDIFSSPTSDQAKNSQASVCSWRTTNEKNTTTTKAGVQSAVSPNALTASLGCLWQCGGRLFPFTQKQDTGFGTVSQSVSSGIPSWSDAKEEGTMEPAMLCSEVPHLQWWCSKRSCLHNYGSSNVCILF